MYFFLLTVSIQILGALQDYSFISEIELNEDSSESLMESQDAELENLEIISPKGPFIISAFSLDPKFTDHTEQKLVYNSKVPCPPPELI